MIKKIAKLNLILNTALTAYSVARLTTVVLKEIAETEKVHSAGEYVTVRFARGDYNNLRGIQTMIYDYKFYNIIERFHD